MLNCLLVRTFLPITFSYGGILNFIRCTGRCEQLNCSLLALHVFSNHPKYAFPLASNQAALQLLHSLHLRHPLQETIIACALFKVNNLTPITSSLPGCAMLVSACLLHRRRSPEDPRARELANIFLPVLKNLCAATPAFKANEPGRPMFEGKPNLWMLHALRSIQSLLEEGKAQEHRWVGKALLKFRRRTSFAAVVAPRWSMLTPSALQGGRAVAVARV